MGYVTWQRPFQGHFVIRRQGLAMINPHIKFEMSTITCNEETKGNAKFKNWATLWGTSGNVHGSSMARWKARGRLPISVNWTFFASSYSWGAMSKYWSKLRCLKGVWVTLSANFRGKGGSSTNDFWCQKTRIPGLSRGVVCVIIRLAVLIQYRRVTHTDR